MRGLSLLGPPIEVRLPWTWPKSRKCDKVYLFWPHEYFFKMVATLSEYAAPRGHVRRVLYFTIQNAVVHFPAIVKSLK